MGIAICNGGQAARDFAHAPEDNTGTEGGQEPGYGDFGTWKPMDSKSHECQ